MHNEIIVIGSRGVVATRLIERLKADDFVVRVITQDEALQVDFQQFNNAGLAILCGQEFVSQQLYERFQGSVAHLRILDVSPTFRTHQSWVYGLSELHDNPDLIRKAHLVANPGCFATAAILLMEPPIKGGLSKATNWYLDGTGGYSSGGGKMIERVRDGEMSSETMFNLTREHRHVPEIKQHAGVKGSIVFHPKIDSATFSGTRMIANFEGVSADDLLALYSEVYQNTDVVVLTDNPSSIRTDDWANCEGAGIRVYENAAGSTAVCTLDNLLKGAVSAAVQNARLMMGRA